MASWPDYQGMDCATAREAISALADGEDAGADSSAVAAHLAGCAACREWQDAAHEVTRRARLAPARPIPDRARDVAAVARARAGAPRRAAPTAAARAGLVAIAAGQLAITVPCLLFGHDRSAPEHVAHELGSFDAALAVGFLVAAWRPGRALGMRALVGVLSALLVTTAMIDLVSGRTNLGDEAPHLLTVAGWLLICYLAWVTPTPAAARTRPAPVAWLRSGLLAPLRRGVRFPAATVAGSGPAGGRAAAAPGAAARLADACPAAVRTACGCAGGRCDCPGCAVPHRAAAG